MSISCKTHLHWFIVQVFGNQGLTWQDVSVSLSSEEDFHLYFVSTQGFGNTPTALDDIELEIGPCEHSDGGFWRCMFRFNGILSMHNHAFSSDELLHLKTVWRVCLYLSVCVHICYYTPESIRVFIAVCSGANFRCPDGKCIPSNSICDNKRDCSNGQDEISCSMLIH